MAKCYTAAVTWPGLLGQLGQVRLLLNLRVPVLLLLVLLMVLLPQMSQQASIVRLQHENFYTAGVVEFRQAVDMPDDQIVADNLAGYLEIIHSPGAEPTDIILFPEATLNTMETGSYVPSVEDEISPCQADPDATYYAKFLVALSCAARATKKYIVINLSEKQLCADTPDDPRPCRASGFNIFNTNVAFDRNGVVVSRYRKVHLYGEPRNTTYIPEVIKFDTDFNVTFGHIICFDIMFYTPAHELVVEHGVRDFLYPTMWFSQLPFLSAVQMQQSWAHGLNVNLLAAGASRPEYGSTGTGIYHGRDGNITSVMNAGNGQRHLYVAQVPKYDTAQLRGRQRRSIKPMPGTNKNNRAITDTEFRMKRDYLESYTTEPLDLSDQQTEGNVTQDVCHGKICCHFELEWKQNQRRAATDNLYSYRLGAYEGWRHEPGQDGNYVRNCAIFACIGSKLEDCGRLLHGAQMQQEQQMHTHLTITRMVIEATYPKSHEFLLMPNSVLDNLLPLRPSQYQWSVVELENRNQLQVRYALQEAQQLDNLLTFAIYGNYYDNRCTFNAGTPEQDIECGFLPTDGGAINLRISAYGLWLLLAIVLTGNLSN